MIMSKKNVPPLPSNYKTASSHFDTQPITLRRKSVCSNKDLVRDHQDYFGAKDTSSAEKGMFKILQQENANLKNQNMFLMNQIRMMTDKEKHYQQMEKKYKAIIVELKSKNNDLEDRVDQLNQLVATEMEMFQYRIKELAINDGSQKKDMSMDWRLEGEKQKNMSLSAYFNSQEIKQKQTSETMSSRKLFEEFSLEFNKLLEEGKEEKQHQKRKQIRRRMTELAIKMEQLKKYSEA